MALNNDTIVDTTQLTHDDLLEAYEKLSSFYRTVKNELDLTSQKLHSEISQRKVLENLVNDFQSELDQANSNQEENLKQSEKKLEELKEKNLQLAMEKHSLERKIDDFGGTIKDLRHEVEELKGLLSEKTFKPRISDSYSKCLESENEEMRAKNHQNEIQLQELMEKYCECQSMIEDYQEKIKCMDENIESKKIELEDKNEVIEHLQEKMHELSTELATLRNPSVLEDNNRKGNSLFAEVDEQRQKMKKILQNERQHYLDMRKAFNAKEIEIRRLRRENLNIKSEIQSCSSLLNRGESLVLQNLKLRVAQLEGEQKTLEALLKEMEMRLIDISKEQNLRWIETMMTSSSKEVREMKDKIFVLTREKNSVIDNCSKTMKDLSRAKLDVVKYKTLLGRIVDEFKLKIKPEKYSDIGVSNEFLDNLKFDEIEDESMDQSVKMEEEDMNDSSIAGNLNELNESTIHLLGGREKLGMAVPDKNEISFKNIASSSRAEIDDGTLDRAFKNTETSSGFAENSSLKNTTEKCGEKSQEISNENVAKENSENPQSRSISTTSIPYKTILQEKIPTVNETDKDESRLTRKRPPIMVKRIIIPSKAPKKEEKPGV